MREGNRFSCADKNPVHACRLWFQADPEHCPLAASGSTSVDVSNKIDDFIDKLYEHPMAVPHASRPGILTSSMIKGVKFHCELMSFLFDLTFTL